MPEGECQLYLVIPLPYELSTTYTCGYIVSTMVPRPWMWITCGEINGDMFGGVEYNDDLYVLNNPLEEW